MYSCDCLICNWIFNFHLFICRFHIFNMRIASLCVRVFCIIKGILNWIQFKPLVSIYEVWLISFNLQHSSRNQNLYNSIYYESDSRVGGKRRRYSRQLIETAGIHIQSYFIWFISYFFGWIKLFTIRISLQIKHYYMLTAQNINVK